MLLFTGSSPSLVCALMSMLRPEGKAIPGRCDSWVTATFTVAIALDTCSVVNAVCFDRAADNNGRFMTVSCARCLCHRPFRRGTAWWDAHAPAHLLQDFVLLLLVAGNLLNMPCHSPQHLHNIVAKLVVPLMCQLLMAAACMHIAP